MIEAIHCGACAHGDDAGILGNTFTCARDGIDRPAHSDCVHGAGGFVEDMRSTEQRYPGYSGAQVWRDRAKAKAFLDKIDWDRVARGQAKVLNLGGVIAIVAANVPLVTNNPQELYASAGQPILHPATPDGAPTPGIPLAKPEAA